MKIIIGALVSALFVWWLLSAVHDSLSSKWNIMSPTQQMHQEIER